MNLETNEMRQAYEADGYVAVPAFLDAAELTTLNRNLERYIRDVVPTLPPEHVFYEDKSRPETLKQLQVMHEHDTYFAELFGDGPFQHLAETLLNDRVIGKNLQYFNKPPGRGPADASASGRILFQARSARGTDDVAGAR